MMEKKEPLYLVVGWQNCVTILKNMKVTQKVKNRKNRSIINFSHSTSKLFTQNNLNHSLKDILALPSSLEQYSQEPKCGNNVNVHQQMRG